MDYRHRILYYLTQTKDGVDLESAEAITSSDFKAEYLSDYNPREGRFLLSAEQWLAEACLDFLNSGAQSLIPIDTLLAHIDRKCPEELREQARAIGLSLKSQTGDGSDIPEIMSNIRNGYKTRTLHQTVMDVKQVLVNKDDPNKGLAKLRDYLDQMEALGANRDDVVYTLGDTVGEHLNDYQRRESDPDAGIGILTGFSPFDKVTGGIKKGEVAIIVGRSKGGKTTTCGVMSSNAYMLGSSVAAAGKEMHGEFIRRRIEAGLLLAEVVDGQVVRKRTHLEGGACAALERGELPEELKQRFIDLQLMFQEEAERGHQFWMLEPGSYSNLKELAGLVGHIKRKHGLDLLWVDSLNIQNPGNSFGERDDLKQGNAVEILRDIALHNDIGVIVDSQERSVTWDKRFVELNEVMMFSASIIHRADHIIRIYRPPTQPGLREFQHLACRNGKLVDPFPVYFHGDDMIMDVAPAGVMRDSGGSEPSREDIKNLMHQPAKGDDDL